MKKYLFTTFHNDENSERNKELRTVLDINLKQDFEKIYLFSNSQDAGAVVHDRLEWVIIEDRPTAGDYLKVAANIPASLIVMANSDIFVLNETLSQITDFYTDSKKQDVVMALSRWDVYNLNVEQMSYQAECFCRVDSQDTFVFFGTPRFIDADYKWGFPGIDNKLTLSFNQHGYRVINPARTIKTYHHHISGQRNYYENGVQVIGSYPPPYLLVEATTLEACVL